MPLGINQNNSFLRLTVDVWQDKIFYNEREYPAAYFAASILNISGEELVDLMDAAGVILKRQPEIVSGDRQKLLELLPTLKAEVLHLAELLWQHPPFCFHDREQETHMIEVMLSPETINDLVKENSLGRDFFLRYLDAIVRIPHCDLSLHRRGTLL